MYVIISSDYNIELYYLITTYDFTTTFKFLPLLL